MNNIYYMKNIIINVVQKVIVGGVYPPFNIFVICSSRAWLIYINTACKLLSTWYYKYYMDETECQISLGTL